MFNVKKTEHINKTFRMPLELVKRLEVLAQNKNVSLSCSVANMRSKI